MLFHEAAPAARQAHRSCVAAILLHALLLTILLYHAPVHVAPMRLPGRATGTQLTLTYLPGRAPSSAVPHAARLTASVARPKLTVKPPTPAPVTSGSEATTNLDLSSGNDGLGQGNISIALMESFPDPRPDLSQLPSGTRGDVVLYAVIGADGRIAHLTLTKGLGHGVDEAVIATVQQWTFRPALRDGRPVPSEQEFHFHYERS